MATVYYLQLSKDQTAELNMLGWDSDIGRQYLAARSGEVDDTNRHLFEKAAVLIANEPESAYMRMQNGIPGGYNCWTEDPYIICFTDFPRSMDVGDYVRVADGTLWRCASCGWIEVNSDMFA